MMRFDLGLMRAGIGAVVPGADEEAHEEAHGGTSALDALDEAIDRACGTGAEIAPEPGAAPAGRRLGALSERYESGGRGPGTVSSGLRDPGGVSYGLYQLASRTGTAAEFINAEGVRWSRDWIGRVPGTSAFSAAWQAVAARDGAAFAEAQHAFIERTHYRPVVAAVKAKTGLDLDLRADAVRDACWSCAVQHGGAAKILAGAVALADGGAGRAAAGYDRRLVEAIYAVRSDYVRRIAQTAQPGARRTLLELAEQRYPSERARALAMLEG